MGVLDTSGSWRSRTLTLHRRCDSRRSLPPWSSTGACGLRAALVQVARTVVLVSLLVAEVATAGLALGLTG